MGVFGCHGNKCYVILIGACFAWYLVYVQSMCVPILRSIGTTLTNLESMQKSYVLLQPTRCLCLLVQKLCGFHVVGDLDLNLWPMFYLLSHALGMKCWNLHAKFHKNPSSINGWYAADTHARAHAHTEGKINSVANIFGARLITLHEDTQQWKLYNVWLFKHVIINTKNILPLDYYIILIIIIINIQMYVMRAKINSASENGIFPMLPRRPCNNWYAILFYYVCDIHTNSSTLQIKL